MVERCDTQVDGEYITSIMEFTGTAAADGVFCYFNDTLGAGLFALLFFGVAFMGILEFSESTVLPLVIGLLVAVVVLPLMPGVGVSFFQAGLILVVVGVVLIVIRRLDRSTN